ncbi:MAG: hypothetical protein JWM10_468, partial [Myxococcaceae bacterium]|nr:hypothetical protein [Myxococcaceae bacterium]
ARVAAVGAEAARALGRDAAAYGYYERAMQKDAGTLRRLGLALPAHVRAMGAGEAPARAATLLGRSPRLRSDDRGFEVQVTGTDAALRVCLRSPLATQLACVDVARARNESSDAFASRAVVAFHAQAFATRVGLSTTDVRSLDGTTTANDAAAREQMNGVLHDIAGPEAVP